MIKRVAHINIVSDDLSASEHFYCYVLGLKKAFEFYKEDKLYGYYIEVGDTTFIEVFLQEEHGEPQFSRIRHFCLEVDDLDEMIKSIRDKGWQITDKKLGSDNAWQAWLRDPSGIDFELHQYTDESSQFTGKPSLVDW